MRYARIKKGAIASLALVTAGIGLVGCSSNTTPDTSTSSGGSAAASDSAASEEKVTITIGTFNNFGYDKSSDTLQGADLYSKYMELHPNVTIKANVAATSDEARAAFNTALGAGTGAYDIQAVDVDWMPDMIKNADKLVDLSDVIPADRFQDWKTQTATTVDGKLLGGGTDIGPEAICYRSDLFAKAGLPTDRKEVAALLTGGWDTYFEVGQQFMAANTGAYWYDSMAATYQGMVNQIESSYIDKDSGEVIALTNDKVKAAYDQLTATTTQSASLKQWSNEWSAAMKSDTGFATMLCPAWIVNNIKNGAGESFVGWDIADVFPNGGGNWGGSYLVIPEQSKNQEAAKELVAWLTDPAQQAEVFVAASNYPGAVKAQKDSAVSSKTDAFLNDAPVGEIFANRAAAVTVVPYKGSSWFDIQTKMADALNRVDVDKSMDAAASWTQWNTDVKALA